MRWSDHAGDGGRGPGGGTRVPAATRPALKPGLAVKPGLVLSLGLAAGAVAPPAAHAAELAPPAVESIHVSQRSIDTTYGRGRPTVEIRFAPESPDHGIASRVWACLSAVNPPAPAPRVFQPWSNGRACGPLTPVGENDPTEVHRGEILTPPGVSSRWNLEFDVTWRNDRGAIVIHTARSADLAAAGLDPTITTRVTRAPAAPAEVVATPTFHPADFEYAGTDLLWKQTPGAALASSWRISYDLCLLPTAQPAPSAPPVERYYAHDWMSWRRTLSEMPGLTSCLVTIQGINSAGVSPPVTVLAFTL